MNSGGLTGQTTIGAVDWNPIVCLGSAFSIPGLKSIGILLLTGVGITAYVRFHDKFSSKDYDERGFTRSKYGTYGTASWMKDKELKEILEIKPPSQADGIILGEKNGSVVCLPKDTRLNRHIAVFGASGTRKSRGVIRPALFTILKRGESAVITDPKAELYNDTAELFRKNGYEVKVFNLVDPRHGDSWNCMSDLNGDTLLAQVLTNVIISNTSEGKGDHFWDNGEANLLKALVLYIDLDRSRSPETKNLAAAYQLLTQNSERQLTALFEKLPLDHPARAPFNLFSQASDTVRSGIVLGLGTRLQVLQNEAVRDIISRSDIDLTAPGKRKCAYFVILSDQDATMAFLSSLFFSFLFIKLVRYADSTPELRCKVPVNLIFDEFNNVGKLGSAADGSDFARTLSVIRSRAIYVMLAVQSLGQLQNRYPNNLWAEIVGNLDVQLMLGCTDEVSAEYFSARSGDMSVEINSTMTVRKTKDTALLTAVSAEDGRFRFEKIPAGNWLVREIEQPKGFVLSEELFPVTVKEQGQVIEIKIANKLIRGSVTLTKYDADYPENKLSGAVFEVYRDVNGNKALDKDDVLLGTMEESSAGVYWMKNLEYGGVLVREKTAPEGFIPDEKAYYVEIDTDGKTYTVENEAGKGFINRALKGSLKIIKTTSDGKKEGFAFRITGANGYDMTFTTDAKGEIFIEKLRIGEYTVTELKNSASEGYKIADPVKITLVANETLTVKIHNDKTKVDVPKTGDDADLMLWISLLGLAAAGVGCTAFFYLKKRRTGKHIAVKK